MQKAIYNTLTRELVDIISETNGLSLNDTLELLCHSHNIAEDKTNLNLVKDFQNYVSEFQIDQRPIEDLLHHPVSKSFFEFFKIFPLHYFEDHIHLTGSLTAEFIYPRLKVLLEGPNKDLYEKKIMEVYGPKSIPIKSVAHVKKLITLKSDEHFTTYLRILYLAKLILTCRKAHEDAAYSMAKELYENYNVGNIRLKFTYSRTTGISSEQIPGLEEVTEEDVVLGLYDGFMRFKKERPFFNFVLSPSFRKELDFFDNTHFNSKKEHFNAQVDSILMLLKKYPFLREYLTEVDTVGDEKELYRKVHFQELRHGFRKLQYMGIKIRSHHGETWRNLRKGVQSVDNAMNIWHIDTLEHGLSLGINPNYYFHRLFQRVNEMNLISLPILQNTPEYEELDDMDFIEPEVKEKLFKGVPLTTEERIVFLKTKFHTAREIEHYQHDVLNRMINKGLSLVALPTSNYRLTACFPDYKDHPFSWWEAKGVNLGIGTDNYITLNTNFIQEILILLYSNPSDLKITKLIMIATKENRRAFISHLLWEMRKEYHAKLPEE